MSNIYKRPRIEAQIPITRMNGGWVIKTDRMFASFEKKSDLKEFMNRCKGFISKLHNPSHPNNAGLFLIMDWKLGLPDSNNTQLAVYGQAIGLPEYEGSPFIILAGSLTMDDVADVWLLMRRKWNDADFNEDNELTGTFDSFREFFIKNSSAEIKK